MAAKTSSEALDRPIEAKFFLSFFRNDCCKRKSSSYMQIATPITNVNHICSQHCYFHFIWQISSDHTKLRYWMYNNFILSSDSSKRRKNPHTWLSSAFSHIYPNHLLSNLSVFQSYAPALIRLMGYRMFVYFYISSVYVANFFDVYIYEKIYSSKSTGTDGSLGASGAIMAVLTHYLLEFS